MSIIKKFLSSIYNIVLDVDDDSREYSYSIKKILVSLILIITSLFMSIKIKTVYKFINILLIVFSLTVIILSIMCIGSSSLTILSVFENLRNDSETMILQKAKNAKMYSYNQIISLIKNNDIISIKIMFLNKLVEIGASSDYKKTTSVFYDKRYYIENVEFYSFDEFCESVKKYFDNGKVKVLLIDDLPPKDWNLR